MLYHLSAPDGGWYISEPYPPDIYCPAKCGSLLDHSYISDTSEMKRGYEFVATYDGRFLVGPRFRDFCARHGYDEVECVPCGPRGKLLELRVKRVLKIDLVRARPRIAKPCIRCGQFYTIVLGAGFFYSEVERPLRDGFWRSDVIWGNGHTKGPVIVIGIETQKRLSEQRFRELRFYPVFADGTFGRDIR